MNWNKRNNRNNLHGATIKKKCRCKLWCFTSVFSQHVFLEISC